VIATLLAVSLAAVPETSYAVIVGNNASPALGRRPLQYADDDAMKYDAVFRGFVDPDRIHLLTSADDDTARLFPEASRRAAAPTRAALKAAMASVAEAAARSRAAGQRTRLYFVFAGHGDVDRGKGFLELQDGAFTGDDLEAALREAGADEAHVILDSCNSFFVLAPRKPGGRHFTTPKDAALQLAERLPNVGVLLSTSAEAEVYEWSELQSGIFSHAVRSALTGAADVDSDGTVTYAELAAFVDTATRTVLNPNLRPQIFARGPRGDAKTTFASLSPGGTQLSATPAGPLRLVLRDAAGLRWFDVHAEAGSTMKLRLPTIDMVVEREGGSVRLSAGASAELEELPKVAAGPAPRGADDALRALFASPYGPKAFAEWQKRADAEAVSSSPYIGLARNDLERMRLLLRVPAQREERTTRFMFAFGMSIAAASLAAGVVETVSNWNGDPATKWLAPAVYGGTAIGGVVAALVAPKIVRGWAERHENFERLVGEGHWQEAVAGADEFIEGRRNVVRLRPWALRLIGGIGVATGVAAFALTFIDNGPWSGEIMSNVMRASGVALVGLSGSMLILGDQGGTPDDDVMDIWREERKLLDAPASTSISIVPLPGGAAMSVSGSF